MVRWREEDEINKTKKDRNLKKENKVKKVGVMKNGRQQ
jgi:hypothetical protein